MTIFANPSKPYYGPYLHKDDGRKDFESNPFRRHLWSECIGVGFICNFFWTVNREMLNTDFDTSKYIIIENYDEVCL